MPGRGQRRTPQRPPSATRPTYDALASLEQQLGRLRAVTGATRVSAWVHEPDAQHVVPFRQAVCDGADLPEPQRTPLALSQSPFLSSVVRTERPVEARADGRRAEDRELAERGLRSAYAEPLLLDDQVVGVLIVEPAAAAAPSALRAAAPQLAIALAEAWSRRSEQRRLAQAEVLLGLIESAATAESLDDMLGSACRRLAELGQVERACVFLLEGGRLVPRMAASTAGRGDPATWQQFRDSPVGLQLADTVLRTGEPLAADRDSGLLSGWWVEKFSVASVLAVPLGRFPHVTGVLTLDGTRVFPEDVRRLAVAAGAHLGGVVEQLRTSAGPRRLAGHGRGH